MTTALDLPDAPEFQPLFRRVCGHEAGHIAVALWCRLRLGSISFCAEDRADHWHVDGSVRLDHYTGELSSDKITLAAFYAAGFMSDVALSGIGVDQALATSTADCGRIGKYGLDWSAGKTRALWVLSQPGVCKLWRQITDELVAEQGMCPERAEELFSLSGVQR